MIEEKIPCYATEEFRIRKEILNELEKYQPTYYVLTLPRKTLYSCYDGEKYFVEKKQKHKDDWGIVCTKTERIAQCTTEYEAQKLVNQLTASIGLISEDEINKYKICPECGEKLIERNGIYGDFIGCSNYPNCNYSRKKWVD